MSREDGEVPGFGGCALTWTFGSEGGQKSRRQGRLPWYNIPNTWLSDDNTKKGYDVLLVMRPVSAL